ncbi:hypothetical protein S40285_02313 [Stachybotrys chlorohalonatus IBT 40285]|uniref:Ribosomal protein S2 n=1 Tax=Stachybotrys chlorohalonatus (strain IBT 40285) TaxID=1283841 RepID=A0A084QSE7_STAC4|nr:hypothetical protein S40285_02313 [Stachybotrys chlorohalonata IBT 40285]
MIGRNVAARHDIGRSAGVTRVFVRHSTSQTTTTPATNIATNPFPQQRETANPVYKFQTADKKKQKAIREGITLLGIDSAHEHRVPAWTRPAKADGTPIEQLTPAQRFAEFNRIQNTTRGLGSRVERRYRPTDLITNPPKVEDISLELLMASQTHMGHNTSLWNPANSRYIYGVRQGIHIISLETTAAHLRRAARVTEEVAYRGGLILFVGTRKGQMEIVIKAAELAGACHLFTKWTPGSITNRDIILRQKEVKVVDQLDQNLGGFDMYKATMRPLMPDLVVCLNPMENYTLLYECGLKNIPTIGVIDTNADPTWVTYAIPANDDSLRSVGVIAGVLGRAGEAGQKRRMDDANSGKVSWTTRPEITRHMKKEIQAVVRERKMVMGRIQASVEGFTEEEQKILQAGRHEGTEEVGEDEMVDMLQQLTGNEVAKTAEAVTGLAQEKASQFASQLTHEEMEKQTADASAGPDLEAQLGAIESELEAIRKETAGIAQGLALNEKPE